MCIIDIYCSIVHNCQLVVTRPLVQQIDGDRRGIFYNMQ